MKHGREKSLLRRHPWIFSGAVERAEGKPQPGETVDVFDSKGNFVARAAYSPESQLQARVWTFSADQQIDRDFFATRIKSAIDYRKFLKYDDPEGACRLIAAESDGLPGVTVDRYGKYLVAQFSSAGADFHKKMIADVLLELTGCLGVYERSDVSSRSKEGLAECKGNLVGELPPENLVISENGMKFKVDIYNGHKTGFYLDQKVNRHIVCELASGRKLLNCFSYTGTFSVAAALGGAEKVVNVDSSRAALDIAVENFSLNSVSDDKYENVEADVFCYLRKLRAEKRTFDMIVLDPPKFIDSQKALDRGCRAYKDIALLGFQLLNPGGILVNFSCSGHMDSALFQKITADALLDSGKHGVIVRTLQQAPDHPVALEFPEALYLKGLVCRIR